jgi:hypothetical protein
MQTDHAAVAPLIDVKKKGPSYRSLFYLLKKIKIYYIQ